MDITWLGHAATRIRTRAAAVVMDPYDKSVGGTMGRPDAHIVTISHDDPLRNGVAGRPSLFHRFTTGKSAQPKRTATGL